MQWVQKELVLPPVRRGFHLITDAVRESLPELEEIRVGILHGFIQHTSASLTINENADPDVPIDMETAFSLTVPESMPFRHTIEGADDMPAHVKSSLLGSSVSIPVRDGDLALGTWQGIYLCEHRDRGSARHLLLTLYGAP